MVAVHLKKTTAYRVSQKTLSTSHVFVFFRPGLIEPLLKESIGSYDILGDLKEIMVGNGVFLLYKTTHPRFMAILVQGFLRHPVY